MWKVIDRQSGIKGFGREKDIFELKNFQPKTAPIILPPFRPTNSPPPPRDKRVRDLRAEILIKIPLPRNRSHASHIRPCPARVSPLSSWSWLDIASQPLLIEPIIALASSNWTGSHGSGWSERRKGIIRLWRNWPPKNLASPGSRYVFTFLLLLFLLLLLHFYRIVFFYLSLFARRSRITRN